MNVTEKKCNPNPSQTASVLSRSFFYWILPLIRKGSRQDLSLDDIYDVLYDDQSFKAGSLLSERWDNQLLKAKSKAGRPSLLIALLQLFGRKFFLSILSIIMCNCVFRVVQPICLRLFIRTFQEDVKSITDQYYYALAICLTTLLSTVTVHYSVFTTTYIAMKCRVSCSALIYRKALRLSKTAQQKVSAGQLINLLSSDAERFDQYLVHIPFSVAAPIQSIILTCFLWQEFGFYCMTGISLLIILLPIQYWNGKMSSSFRREISKWTDDRSRVMSEIIIAMRVIKMYAWEKPFTTLINRIRKLEANAIQKKSYLRGVYFSLYSISLKLVPFVIILTYGLNGNVLAADKVFFVVAIINTIAFGIVCSVPGTISGIGEMFVSIRRIENFLLLEERNSGDNFQVKTKMEVEGELTTVPTINMKSVYASWTSTKVTLDNINLQLRGSKLIAIVGPVGSGKTSLLHVLIKELPIKSGKCFISGSSAYSCQDPWIFAANIRQNILFGLPYNKEQYWEVVRVCSLEEDLNQLPFGDMTLIGERGVSLSGGQKARVNLARALYQRADIYVMDDPLSAVDSRVSRHLFEECIQKHLKDCLRIVVTHQLQYLPQTDYIVVLEQGKIAAQGTYCELIDQGIDFLCLLEKNNKMEKETNNKKETSALVAQKCRVDEFEKQYIEAEKLASGSVSAKTYYEYFKSAKSTCFFTALVIIFVISQVCFSMTDYWLTVWINAEKEKDKLPKHQIHFVNQSVIDLRNQTFYTKDIYLGETVYIEVYAVLVLGVMLLSFLRSFGFGNYCTRISINIHNGMFATIIRAPLKFFDKNPSGRLMNQFTKELAEIDERLPMTFFDTIALLLNVFGVVALVIASNYYMIVPSIIVFIVFGFVRRHFIKTTRDVKRIEGVVKSPVFSHVIATVQGLTTIRASRAEEVVIQQFDNLQDLHSGVYYVFMALSRCLGFWIEMASFPYLVSIIFSFLVISTSETGGHVGLAITSALSIANLIQMALRQSAETENQMTSVERALYYMNLQSEAPLDSTKEKQPPNDWPRNGEILFRNVSFAYDERDVLRNLNFDIKARENIGIVGRTGAGKSSIIQALFRLAEPRGDIFIDGVRLNDIGLHDLRKSISIIPQDPVLFSGTVRYNLDPFGQFLDEEIWKVIEEMELKYAVPALDFHIEDSGSNFSLGQRQLMCLARAILRNNKIIIMDEATANVDPGTDNLIQETIRKKFSHCTVITIAHRLQSVMNCDRILVLDNGEIKEYDHPHVLLKNPDGVFTAMMEFTGEMSCKMLKKIAAEAYNGPNDFQGTF